MDKFKVIPAGYDLEQFAEADTLEFWDDEAAAVAYVSLHNMDYADPNECDVLVYCCDTKVVSKIRVEVVMTFTARRLQRPYEPESWI